MPSQKNMYFKKGLYCGAVGIVGSLMMVYTNKIPPVFLNNTLGAIGFTMALFGLFYMVRFHIKYEQEEE